MVEGLGVWGLVLAVVPQHMHFAPPPPTMKPLEPSNQQTEHLILTSNLTRLGISYPPVCIYIYRNNYFYFDYPHPLLVEIPWGWALQEHSGRETLGRLWSWALQGHFGVGHSRDERGVDRARRRVPGEENSSGRGAELSLKSNNPTPRVVK